MQSNFILPTEIPNNKAKLSIKIWTIFFQSIEIAIKIAHNKYKNRNNNQTSYLNMLKIELNSSLILDSLDKIAISLFTASKWPNLRYFRLTSVGLKS